MKASIFNLTIFHGIKAPEISFNYSVFVYPSYGSLLYNDSFIVEILIEQHSRNGTFEAEFSLNNVFQSSIKENYSFPPNTYERGNIIKEIFSKSNFTGSKIQIKLLFDGQEIDNLGNKKSILFFSFYFSHLMQFSL